MTRLADFGFGGDANPADQPQYQNDHDVDSVMHDEPDYEPGSAEYNFFYGNGQLHVSPHHDHDQLRDHAGVAREHTGPMAVGTVDVVKGRATWSSSGSIGLRGLSRVFKDYTKNVGWRWGGLTDLEGQPIDDSFAPKKSMVLKDNETGKMIDFVLQGKTAFIDKLNAAQAEMIRGAGYKIAEFPGGTNMNDRIKTWEHLDTYNRYTPTPNQNTDLPDESTPRGHFKCPKCSQTFDGWSNYMDHRRQEDGMGTEEPAQDGKFPTIDLDKTLPAHHHDKNPTILPLASWKEIAQVSDFELYASLWGFDNDEHKHYGAFLQGVPVGYATVKETGERSANVVMVRSILSGRNVGRTLTAALCVFYDELTTESLSQGGRRLANELGMVTLRGGISKWAAGQTPKDMIDAPVPLVYDIDKDQIVIGHPGERTSDIPGKFTPGGIVEGMYEPGGKVVINTATNMPWTVRHLIDLWYWSHPQMEVTGVELQDASGATTKLASKLGTTEVGHYIKTIAATDPSVWNAYQALRNAGGKVYVVGGAVRDALLQKEPKDIDLMVTGVPAETVNHVLEGLPGRVDLTGKNFGVYRYKTKGHEVEIALPRTEQSTGDRRVDFDVKVDHELPVESDLLRRDFTINAMAVDLDSGKLVDPYRGAEDLEHRRLRTTHPSSFKEDPTRLLRALVMQGRYGMTPDEDTRHQMDEHGHRLPLESADAKQPIIEKILKSNNPAAAIRLAHETGLLKHVFPEIEQHFDYDQNNPHHNYSLGEHLLNVLHGVSEISDDPDLRMSALLHDIGKPASAWVDPVSGHNHYYLGPNGEGADHAKLGAEMAETRLRDLRWPKARMDRIKHLVSHHMFPAFSGPKGARKFLNRVGNENANDLLDLRYADQRGKGQSDQEVAARTHVDKQRELVEKVRSAQEPTSQAAISVNGNDLLAMGVPAGPAIGSILRSLTNDVIEDPSLNDRNLLIQRAKEYANAA